MANVLLAFNNRVDAATLSGGAYQATLPLTNLQNRTYGRVARSTNLLLASTMFNVDFGSEKLIRTFALAAHNIGLEGKVRVRADIGGTFTSPQYDSGWVSVWPAVYDTLNLPWEHEAFWTGTYSEEEREGYNWTHIVSAPSTISARYLRIEVDDPTNTDGFVQFGRFFVGDAWQSKVNMNLGNAIGWETASEAEMALSGTEYFDERPMWRAVQFTTGWMNESEAMGNAFDLMRRSNTTREVIFQYDPDDTLQALRRSFIGRLRALNKIEHPLYNVYGAGWEVKELI